jgi:hypothetical protein
LLDPLPFPLDQRQDQPTVFLLSFFSFELKMHFTIYLMLLVVVAASPVDTNTEMAEPDRRESDVVERPSLDPLTDFAMMNLNEEGYTRGKPAKRKREDIGEVDVDKFVIQNMIERHMEKYPLKTKFEIIARLDKIRLSIKGDTTIKAFVGIIRFARGERPSYREKKTVIDWELIKRIKRLIEEDY